MAKQSMDEFNRSRDRMARDLNAVIADSEALITAAAEVSGEGFAAARAKFEDKLKSARACLADMPRQAAATARETAAAADDYAHARPWIVIGIAAGVGMLIGLLAARR